MKFRQITVRPNPKPNQACPILLEIQTSSKTLTLELDIWDASALANRLNEALCDVFESPPEKPKS